MKYFLDAEFHEDGKTIELISIALVSQDGRRLYFENADYDWDKSTDWLKENVYPHLEGGAARERKRIIVQKILNFVNI
jgi:hypothetical protein